MSAGSEDRELAAIAERAREIALQTRLAAAESEVAGLRAALTDCLRLAECQCSVPEVPGVDWSHIVGWCRNSLGKTP